MENLADKIQSLKQTIGGVYIKPSPERVLELCDALKSNQEALDYLTITRGLNENTIDNFKLGYDIERNAISIPVFKRGEVINIKYRHLDPESKSKYTAEKGCEVWIFNEDGVAKGQEKGGILIVEGEIDAMSCWQAGIKNVISPASGKDSYGVWLELLDTIPKVYIAYDNDKPGKKSSKDIAERLGVDKCFEVLYPEDIKDANDYFKKFSLHDYKVMISKAKPYYRYTFSGVADVIESLREKKEDLLKLKCVPFIEFEEDWLVILSGISNSGKTSFSMNIANEFAENNIPTLIMPFERGIKTVGKRFLQVICNKTQNELEAFDDSDWDKTIEKITDLPVYFSMPTRDEIKELIAKARKIFGIKVVIIDHLDYLVRKSGENHNLETSNTLQEFKSLAQEHNIIFIVVHHIKKQEGVGSSPKKPRMEDLKGSSSTYQDPEAVIMLSVPEKGQLEVDIVKNKGTMGSRIYKFTAGTGVVGEDITEVADPYNLDNF